MPYSIVHKGLAREFDFYAPLGWQNWLMENLRQNQRFTLPLVVALHGGAQDELNFQRQWFFPDAWAQGAGGAGPPRAAPIPDTNPTSLNDRLLHNQFFVLYPYGAGWTTYSLWARAYLGADTPGKLNRRTLRGWNAGFTGYNDNVKDVSFIRAAINHVDAMLKAELLQSAPLIQDFPWLLWGEGEAPSVIDPDRRYLFGYSNGAMMAHRLVHKHPDYWAALWTLAGTCGGKAHAELGSDQSVTVNLPSRGKYGVSLFAHHGDRDSVVPPGGYVSQDYDIQAAHPGDPTHLVWDRAGFPHSTQWRQGYLPMNQALHGYAGYNRVDLAPGESPTLRTAEGIAGPGRALVASLPDGPDPNAFNPVVTGYRDTTLGHSGFADHANRYFDTADIWQFFRHHPRVPLAQARPNPNAGIEDQL